MARKFYSSSLSTRSLTLGTVAALLCAAHTLVFPRVACSQDMVVNELDSESEPETEDQGAFSESELEPTLAPSPSPLPTPSGSAGPLAEIDMLPAQAPLDPLDRLIAELWIPPLLAQLEAMPYLKVRDSGGTKRLVKIEETLKAGDVFQTAEKGAARIVYEDGTQILIGGNTSVQIDFDAPLYARTEEQTIAMRSPLVNLLSGEVRILVPPAPERAYRSRTVPTRVRFVLKTPEGFIGVRGTDFVVKVGEKGSSVHVMHGEIEISEKLEKIRLHQGGRVGNLYFVETFSDGKAPNRPRPFLRSELISEQQMRQPLMQPMWVEATHARKQQLIRAQLDAIRDARLSLLARIQKVDLKTILERILGTPESKAKAKSALDPVLDMQPSGKRRHRIMDPHIKILPPRLGHGGSAPVAAPRKKSASSDSTKD